jgi:hypothetical protein
MATFGDFRDEQVLATISEIPHEEILFLQWSGSVIKDKGELTGGTGRNGRIY